jgi:hypothetical protein
MLTFKRTSGIEIPRTYLKEDFYTKIKDFLRRRVKSYQTSDFSVYNFFVENKESLIVPRFFPMEMFLPDCEVQDSLSDGQDIDIQHSILLRDTVQHDMVDYLLKNDRGIIQAPPGSGKTVVCIYAIAERKKKAFILVHRSSLCDQWKGPGIEAKQGFLSFTSLSEKDVAILDSSSFVEDLKKPIIISTNQTFVSLLKREPSFPDELRKANIGIFVADEVHTSVGAPIFSLCSIHVPAKVVFGFSATPYRWDGNEDIIRYHLGEVFIPSGTRETVEGKVTFLMFDFGIRKTSLPYIYWGCEFQKSRYLNLLRKAGRFVSVCKSLLKKFSEDGRQVIFVAERIKLLTELYDWLDHPNKSEFFGKEGNERLEYQVTFATPGKIRDGVDAPKKDCLILTSPIGNIEQMCGRIERVVEGKKNVIVVDMVDLGFQEISRTMVYRLKYYEKKKWSVRFVKLSENGYEEITKKQALELAKIATERRKNEVHLYS